MALYLCVPFQVFLHRVVCIQPYLETIMPLIEIVFRIESSNMGIEKWVLSAQCSTQCSVLSACLQRLPCPPAAFVLRPFSWVIVSQMTMMMIFVFVFVFVFVLRSFSWVIVSRMATMMIFVSAGARAWWRCCTGYSSIFWENKSSLVTFFHATKSDVLIWTLLSIFFAQKYQ